LAFRVTTGKVDDRAPVWQMAEELWGQLYGGRGYISKALHDDLLAHGVTLMTLLRRTMKPRLMRLWDRLMLRKRFLIETVNDPLKNISQIEHARHRSLTGFMVNLVGGRQKYQSSHPLSPQQVGMYFLYNACPVPR
jgi:hypothetical protein